MYIFKWHPQICQAHNEQADSWGDADNALNVVNPTLSAHDAVHI